MQALTSLNKLVVFLLEICMILALGYWGVHCFKGIWLPYIFGIGTPLLAAVLWGTFAAPKSKRQLPLPYRVVFSIAMFWASGILLYQAGLTGYAVTMMVVALIAEGLVLILERESA